MENAPTDVPSYLGKVGRCLSGTPRAQTGMHSHTSHCCNTSWSCGCTSREAKAGTVRTPGLKQFLCSLCCWDICSAGQGSWGFCERAGTTTLQGHKRTPQLTAPSAVQSHGQAVGKCSCSPQHHGKAIAAELGVIFCMLLQLLELLITYYAFLKLFVNNIVWAQIRTPILTTTTKG